MTTKNGTMKHLKRLNLTRKTDWMYVPLHEKLSKTKTTQMLKKYQIEFEELPLLSIRDPAIRRLQDGGVEVNIGDVIQITRKSKTGGDSSLYFRRVDYE